MMLKTIEQFGIGCNFSMEARSALRQAVQILEQFPQTASVFSSCQMQLFNQAGSPWVQLDALSETCGVHRFTVHQIFLIVCAAETFGRYREAGYSQTLYWDAMKDLKYKMEETRQVYGVWGVYCAPWLASLILMKCFCLGRLQFEVLHGEFQLSLAGSSLHIGEPVVNIHIPSFGKLQYEEVLDSYRRAAYFFKQVSPNDAVWFRCETWMLDPQVNKLLPEGNMKRFTEDFTVVKACVDPEQDDRYRIFHVPPQTPIAAYPVNNTLQRRLKAWLLDGNRMGVGFGLLLWKDGEVIAHA